VFLSVIHLKGLTKHLTPADFPNH